MITVEEFLLKQVQLSFVVWIKELWDSTFLIKITKDLGHLFECQVFFYRKLGKLGKLGLRCCDESLPPLWEGNGRHKIDLTTDE